MNYDWGRTFGSVATGAAAGSAIAPGIGTAIGGTIGFLTGLFGTKDYEAERRQRYEEWIRRIEQLRTKRLSMGNLDIAKGIFGAVGEARLAAKQRAYAGGHGGNVERYIAPAEARTGAATAGVFERFQRETNADFDRARLQAEGEFASRPIEPGASEYLTGIGENIASYKLASDAIKAMGDNPTTVESGEGAIMPGLQGGAATWQPEYLTGSEIMGTGLDTAKPMGNQFANMFGRRRYFGSMLSDWGK